MTPPGVHSAGRPPRWGMVIDLNRCVGCQTCTVACKHANDTTPGVQWRRVLDVEQGTFPDVERLFLVVGCQHCADPPCVPVCPTGATRQRADGLVTMNYDQCIGCAYCAVSCPYQARTIVHDPHGYFGRRDTVQERATAHPERRGVAQKCTFCQDRVDQGRAAGLRPGVDPEATPACAAACIASAIHFGDFNDPESNVSRLTRDNPSLQMHAELGTDPQLKYLYTTPAVPGRDTRGEDNDEERLSDPANPLVGTLQRFWDWRAAMNWCFGGTGSGLAFLAWLAWSARLVDARWLAALWLAAAALVAVGLFFVFLKIGRQLRSWRALSRPGSSWMSRELYAVGLFYCALTWSLIQPGTLPSAVTAAAALAFLVCQAKILHRARGIPAWRLSIVPWMIVASGLLEGAGALMMGSPRSAPAYLTVMLVVVLLAGLNALLWRRYVEVARGGGIGPLALRRLAAVTPAVHLLAHAAPVVLLIAAFFVIGGQAGEIGEAAALLSAAAGAAAILGGALWKFTVIARAGYHQGFALPRLPQRGSGRNAAPARLSGRPAAA